MQVVAGPMPTGGQVFLSAEWRDLLMVNYEVDPSCLRAYVPTGTELDSFDGNFYISLVGFRFCNTKYRSILPNPLRSEFDEVNLRFYVRRRVHGEIRRGVVFIAEIVPSITVAKVARWFYGENYVRRPVEHSLDREGAKKSIEYRWRESDWCKLHACFLGEPGLAQEGSLEQLISEHYWGYSRRPDGTSLEYRVEHVPWKIWTATEAGFEGDPSDLYGKELAATLENPPTSALVAEGSFVTVSDGMKLS